MGRLIAIVGSTGVGKTALVQALVKAGPFTAGMEQHLERPFQQLFKQDPRYALANQIDYLLQRAQQENTLRQSSLTGLTDGGLDMDFHGFTRLFHARGWLSDAEFDLCRHFYEFIRGLLPPPELVIHMTADPAMISQRLAMRDRINIASAEDTARLEGFLIEWLATLEPGRLLTVDANDNDPQYHELVPRLIIQISESINKTA